MSDIFYSLIIPCHNPKINELKRLFDSLIDQGSEINKVKIIVIDDNSSSLEYQDFISENYKELNIIFRATDVEIHCPGNTRREGMKYIEGEYLFFCDQDDYFEKNILLKITEFINTFSNNKKPPIISTIMWSYNQEEDTYDTEFAHRQAWLHGKWYNIKDFIIPFEINFKKDLITHEDVYFNSLVISHLFELGINDFTTLDIKTYRWVNNPDSLTREKREDRGYFFENFKDYIISAAEPYWVKVRKGINDKFSHQIMMTLLHCYFYYEAASFFEGPQRYKDIAEYIEQYIKAIVNELNFSLDDIVNYLYADPYKYYLVLEDCRPLCNYFIPKTSLRDFIYILGNR